VTEAVNHGLPAFYAYVADRERRRQAHVEAVDRAAAESASDPIDRERRRYAATRSAVKEFDAAEPALGYTAWRDSA
jgi:hypothetical protein